MTFNRYSEAVCVHVVPELENVTSVQQYSLEGLELLSLSRIGTDVLNS